MERFAFAGRTCVITGAASGIGRALTLDLARRRALLALVDRDAEGLEQVATLARELGAKDVSTYVVDLADGGDRLDLAAAVAERHGGADLLVNNAGVALSGTFDQVSMKDFDWLLEINLHAVIRTTKAFLPQLLSRPGAHVVNISSLFGLVAPPTQVAYVTSKYGVRGLTKVAALELGHDGIRVNSVHPGGVLTDMVKNVGDDGQSSYYRRLPAGRIGVPEDVTNLVLFLASDESSYCTGTEFVIDGGMQAGDLALLPRPKD